MTAAAGLRQYVETLRVFIAGSGLPEWWTVVGRSLWSLLPQSAQDRLSDFDRRIWLRLTENEVIFLRQLRHGMQEIERLPLDDDQILADLQALLARDPNCGLWLLLEPKQVLRKTLRLPLAAELKLRDLLKFEIDRQTPFAAQDVQYAGRVLKRLAEQKQVEVEMIVLPSAALTRMQSQLGPLGSRLLGVTVTDERMRPLPINLLPSSATMSQADPNRKASAILATFIVASLLVTGVATKSNRSDKLEEITALRDESMQNAREARALRNELASAAKAANFLAARTASQPAVLEVIDELTQRLPDDTYLERLSIEDTRLIVTGLSRSAPALVNDLQNSQVLNSAALGGAVQTDQGTGLDRFMLTANISIEQPERSNERK